ncbi:MAG: hypothetical protein QXL01_05645 [Thermoplasmatales archaeon]
MIEKLSVFILGQPDNQAELMEKFYDFGLKAEPVQLDEEQIARVNGSGDGALLIAELDDEEVEAIAELISAKVPVVTLDKRLSEILSNLRVRNQFVQPVTNLHTLAGEIISAFLWLKEGQQGRRIEKYSRYVLRASALGRFSLDTFCEERSQARFIEEHTSEIPPKTLNQLKRFALIGSGIMSKIDEKLANKVGLLHAVTGIGFRQNFSELMLPHANSKELASKLKDIAIMASIRIKDEWLTESIHRLANYFEGSKVELQPQEIVYVSSREIAASCFPRGVFRPNGAYLILNALDKSTQMDQPENGRKVKEAISSFLAEILSESVTRILTSPAKLSKDQIRRIFNIVNEPVNPDEKVVSLSDLRKGQKVSKPIVDFEGRQLVEKETILDQEIIERLIKVACLTPILDPVIKKE